MSRILHIIRKEFIQIKRDRAMRGLILLMPILQLLLLGYVISSEVRHVSVVICDLDQTFTSRQLIDRFRNTVYFDVKYFENEEAGLHKYLDRGEAAMALVLPAHLERNLQNLEPSAIQLLLDGQDVNTTGIAMGYAAGILESFVADRLTALSAGAAMDTIHLLSPALQVWYNPNLKPSDYMIPGIVVFLLTMVTSLISAMGLVREREIGTLDQLLVAPIKKTELLIGKIIPFAILGLVELALSIVFARLWYHIPLVGNLLLFFVFSVIYLFTTLGLGLFVSASSRTQQQAMFLTWFCMMFILLMSGFLFPIENMPTVAQYLTWLNPMRYFIVVTRELFIKGAGLQQLYTQGLALSVFGGVIFTFAALRFQKRLG
jgi:ABC-2 type transport system permease protein